MITSFRTAYSIRILFLIYCVFEYLLTVNIALRMKNSRIFIVLLIGCNRMCVLPFIY